MDSAVRLGLSHPRVIAERLATLRGSGRWGCRLIDRLLPDSGGHSPLERSFLRIVRRAGLDRPRTQVIHRDAAGRHVARVDFEIEDQWLIVEVTGRLGHVTDAERTRDAQRRNELQDLGYRVIEYTSTQVFEQPGWVAADLRRRLS
jgi:very-short-patch-repair endonuclease